MSERETRDFMSVDSFSQLPFIRPAPTRSAEKPSSSASTFRLFGIEVPHEPDTTHEDPFTTANPNSSGNGNGNGESDRKFECHYCCRHFPTSQALGGHQNAHKRERQHAKRAQFQSAMSSNHQSAAAAADGHPIYTFHNHHHHRRLASLPAAGRFGFHPTATHQYYPSWSSSPSSTTRTTGSTVGGQFYGELGSVSQPITGSPLPGLWRIPTVVQGGGSMGLQVHGDRTTPLPLFGGDHDSGVLMGVGLSSTSTSVGSFSFPPPTSPQSYQSAGVKENVSLDLHL